jgi:hypothetical protein
MASDGSRKVKACKKADLPAYPALVPRGEGQLCKATLVDKVIAILINGEIYGSTADATRCRKCHANGS